MRTALKKILYLLVLISFSAGLFSTFSRMNRVSAGNPRLYLAATASSYKVGDTVTVYLFVDAGGSTIDAAEGRVSYPTDMFNHIATSVSGTEFVFWTNFPEENNGIVDYGGGKPYPGYSGAAGKILTLVLQAKKVGTATISTTGRALLNGTVVTNTATGVSVTITEAPAAPSTGGSTGSTSTAPVQQTTSFRIYSSTHPDPTQSYANPNPKFSWTVPSGSTAISIVYDRNPGTIPPSKASGLVSNYELQNLADGTWYLHVKFLSAKGWGASTHFRFNIKPPEAVATPSAGPVTPPLVELYEVELVQSGVVDTGTKKVSVSSVPIEPRGHYVKIVANDPNGNVVERTVKSSTDDKSVVPPKLEDPYLAQSLAEPVIEGKTNYPNSEVVVSLQKESQTPKRFLVSTNNDGKFTFSKTLDEGKYDVWAEVIDSNGMKSYASEKKTFEVKQDGKEKQNSSQNQNKEILIFVAFIGVVAVSVFLLRKRLLKR